MAQLVIENLESNLLNKLQQLAQAHGRSIEEEARDILRAAVDPPVGAENAGLGTRIARRFAALGLDQEIPELRGGRIEVPNFESCSYSTPMSFPR